MDFERNTRGESGEGGKLRSALSSPTSVSFRSGWVGGGSGGSSVKGRGGVCVGDRFSKTALGADRKGGLYGTDARATCSRDREVEPDNTDVGGLTLGRGGRAGRSPDSALSTELAFEGDEVY